MSKRNFINEMKQILCLGMLFFGLDHSLGQEQPSSLGRPVPIEHLGKTLLSELNCVACHSASSQTKRSLNSKQAPFLGDRGVPLTPQFLREYLMQPHSVGQGRTMPDVLHKLSFDERKSVVEGLIHFLISIQPKIEEMPIAVDAFKLEKGRQLFHSIGCVACHSPQETIEELKTSEIQAPRFTGVLGDRFVGEAVPIGDLSRKTSVLALADFLKNPLASRPSGRMPSLNLSSSESLAIAMYLARGQATALFDQDESLQKTRGLRYTYFEFGNNERLSTKGSEDFADHFPGNLSESARSSLRVAASGMIDEITDEILKRPQQVGLIFSGYFTVKVAGEYTFFTTSDDGSRLYLGDELVVQNDGDHGEQERSGTIQLEVGDHPIKLTYYNRGGGGALDVEYDGPNIPRQNIDADLLSHFGQAMKPIDEEDFVLDKEKVRAGKGHFTNYGCAQCHSIDQTHKVHKVHPIELARSINSKKEFVAPDLEDLEDNLKGGCMSDSANLMSDRASRYFLRKVEREALRDVLQRLDEFDEVQSEVELEQKMNLLNCFACHRRGGRGGPMLSRSEYFRHSKKEMDLGDEGRLPPHLDGVGGKLRKDWMNEVLLKKGVARPYMKTRMPQFGEGNVASLGDLFERVDDPFEDEDEDNDHDEHDDDEREIPLMDTKYGRRLLGIKGLGCITCHTYGAFDSLGIPAMDLMKMTSRLRRNWFHKYLLDPASLRPGTRMPSFFPDGKSVNMSVFGGDADRQIDALWGFLKIADDGNPPEGLVRGKRELIATDEAVIYRHWIKGAGARAIGVGYPEKGNLAFDAEAMRLALIWQGSFIDTARHSSGRGSGFEPPLGHNVITFPEGAPFDFLNDHNEPWQKEIGKIAGYDFKGYRLDEFRRPTFLYSFEDVEIEDFFLAVETELDATFRRYLRFVSDSNAANLWMKIAHGKRIEPRPEGIYVIDGRLHLSFKLAGSKLPFVKKVRGRSELFVPIEFKKGEASIEVEMIW